MLKLKKQLFVWVEKKHTCFEKVTMSLNYITR